MNTFSLNGKRAIITGSASGIGKAIASTFARAGAEVMLVDISVEGGQNAEQEIKSSGSKATFYELDICQYEQVESVIRQISSSGNIDILVNNAGIAHVGNIEQTEPDDFEKVMSVNVSGMFHCIKSCIPVMRAQGHGVILNIASTVATVAIPDRLAYTTSKGAVLMMTYSVALDYVAENIRCNAISPGRVHTPFVEGFIAKNYPGKEKEMFKKLSSDHPIGRMAKPQEIANTALFLCSDEASYITGSNYEVDGGFVNLRHREQ